MLAKKGGKEKNKPGSLVIFDFPFCISEQLENRQANFNKN
jgi:hypothetical protein